MIELMVVLVFILAFTFVSLMDSATDDEIKLIHSPSDFDGA